MYWKQQSIIDTAAAAAAAAKSLQSCPTLCNPIDGSPPGSPVPGILQARTLEWVAISFSNSGKWKVKGKLLSRIRLLVTPWTAAYQAPLSNNPIWFNLIALSFQLYISILLPFGFKQFNWVFCHLQTWEFRLMCKVAVANKALCQRCTRKLFKDPLY